MAGPLQRSDLGSPAPDGSQAGLIPVEYSTQIIQEAAKSSMALSTFRQVRMPTQVHNLPVLDVLPVATWVTGEPAENTGTGGEKAATTQEWKGAVLTAEEIAAIVVIPEAVLEDASINLWAEITPRLAESIGAAIDGAAFFGTNAPTSWGAGIVADAKTAGSAHVEDPATQDGYNTMFGLVEEDGFPVRRVYAPLSEKANFRSWNASGVPVYLTEYRDDGRVDQIYGVPISYAENGSWNAAEATAVAGDPTKAIIGTRTDMQVRILREATVDVSVAQDGSGLVHLAQQDSVALRVRARFGFVVANPVTRENPTAASRYPFAVIDPTP